MKKSVLVIFKKSLSRREKKRLKSISECDVVIAPIELQQEINELGYEWVGLERLVESGSIYEATAFAEELSRLTLPNGTRVSKSLLYKGYELWWIHYDTLFLNFCVPYTQYKNLLAYLLNFEKVYLYEPPFRSLFLCYLQAYERNAVCIKSPGLKPPTWLPFGMFVQIFLTIILLPSIIFQRKKILVFTGDKFEGENDFDFRMRFIYEELRRRKIPFVECIRSLESWKTVFNHALRRHRPVFYSAAVTFMARYMSVFTGSRAQSMRQFDLKKFMYVQDVKTKFKLMVAHQYLLTAGDDVWEIRIMQKILRIASIKAAFIAAANERNFHTVLACKLNKIPVVGILHGVASKYYNVYDFMGEYDGEKTLTVDKYGLWSEWWKEYYIKNSKSYRKEQLYVSGPMRPLVDRKNFTDVGTDISLESKSPIKVLFISEQLAMPEEVLPFLEALMETKNTIVYMKFRPYRDEFELWLKKKHPRILLTIGEERILRSDMMTSISQCDVVVGSHSTAVLEATLQNKPFVLFDTKKWGDYFDMQSLDKGQQFFAKNPEQLTEYVYASISISSEVIKDLQTKFFGDPYQNGSSWAVDQLVLELKTR